MRFFIKLTVLVLVMPAWAQAEGSRFCDTSSIAPSVSLYGWGFLELFPYESAPYDDFMVEVEYHDHSRRGDNTLVIGLVEEGDPTCHVLKRKVLAADNKISFFNLINADTDKEVGFGSCLYEGGKKKSCEYLFEHHLYGMHGKIKVYVDIIDRKFKAYTLYDQAFEIGVSLEE